MNTLLFAALLSTSSIIVYRPDPAKTPGAIDPTKTAAILCAKGYTTKKVRPPESYTGGLKKKQLARQGLSVYEHDMGRLEITDERIFVSAGDYEEDHLISLELGGDPKSPLNLWPQRYCPPATAGKTCFGAREKDRVEDYLHLKVCSGKLTLAEAQDLIRHDWFSVYKNMYINETICEGGPNGAGTNCHDLDGNLQRLEFRNGHVTIR